MTLSKNLILVSESETDIENPLLCYIRQILEVPKTLEIKSTLNNLFETRLSRFTGIAQIIQKEDCFAQIRFENGSTIWLKCEIVKSSEISRYPGNLYIKNS